MMQPALLHSDPEAWGDPREVKWHDGCGLGVVLEREVSPGKGQI